MVIYAETSFLFSYYGRFDILHVAAAKMIGATHCLSFDSNQKRLAEKEGLNVPL